MKLKNILFLCKDNSSRSQMAEGLAKNYFRGRFNIFSAGLEPDEVHPYVFEVMNEIGIDISRQISQHINEFNYDDLDYVVTLCEKSEQCCPALPRNVTLFNQSIDDPFPLSEREIGEEEILDCYRTVRDDIKNFVEINLDSMI